MIDNICSPKEVTKWCVHCSEKNEKVCDKCLDVYGRPYWRKKETKKKEVKDTWNFLMD